MRMTLSLLESKVDLLNRRIGRLPGDSIVGEYQLDRHAGGTRLVRVVNEGRGTTNVSERGTMREAHDFICGMLYAIEAH